MNKFNKRPLIGIILIILVSGLLVGCGKKELFNVENSSVKQIIFRGVEDFNENKIIIKEITKDFKFRNKNVANAFLIDLTELKFKSAAADAIAAGNVLYKCLDWSSNDGKCIDGKWDKLKELVIGEDYSFNLDKGISVFIEIVDIDEPKIKPDIKLRDSEGKEVDKEIRIIDRVSGNELIQEEVCEGYYDVRLKFKDSPVEEIYLNKVHITNDSVDLGVDEVLETNVPEKVEFKKIYAIDPTKTDFEKGIVKSVAKAKNLYKCKEWNFTEQKCYGEWIKIMDLVPGQEYNFEISDIDPVFAEGDVVDYKPVVKAGLSTALNRVCCKLKSCKFLLMISGGRCPPGDPAFGEGCEEDIETRGENWNLYDLNGTKQIFLSTEPLNFFNGTSYEPINTTIVNITNESSAYSYGYGYCVEKGKYQACFKLNSDSSYPVAFNVSSHVLRTKLVKVGYLDPSQNNTYIILQNVNNKTAVVDGNTISYNGVFTGANVTYIYETGRLKENITCDASCKNVLQNNPPSGFGLSNANSYLVWVTELDYQNLNVYVNNTNESGNNFTTENNINFKDVLGKVKYLFPAGNATDANGSATKIRNRLIHENGKHYLLSGIKVSAANSWQTPITFDPTIALEVNSTIEIILNETAALPIKSITVHNFSDNGNNTIYLDSVENNSGWNELYAVNPEELDFTDMTVKATASNNPKNKILYKCSNWNFTNQSCYGDWIAWRAVIPGENYTIILNATDPGLAEGSGTFFDGFESGSLATNNWTTSGAGSAWAIDTTPYAGTYNIMTGNTDGESIIETNVDTTGYANIMFSFYYTTNKIDTGEYIAADWYNGTDWVNVLYTETDLVGVYSFGSYNLSATADNNTDFKIRFRCSSGGPNENCYVDNVQIEGEGPPPSPTIKTNKIYYDRGETVNVNGSYYSANTNVTIDIKNSIGRSVDIYPKNVTSDGNGNINDSWTIPSDLTFKLGNYTITANDTTNSSKNNQTTIKVVLKPDSAFVTDKNQNYVDVKSNVNESDNIRANIWSDVNEDYMDITWQNNISDKATINNVDFYIEHYEATSYNLTLQWWNGTGYEDVCIIEERVSENFDNCSVSQINTAEKANNISLRITDKDTIDNSDWSYIDFVYLYIDFTEQKGPAVIMIWIEPESDQEIYRQKNQIGSTQKTKNSIAFVRNTIGSIYSMVFG